MAHAAASQADVDALAALVEHLRQRAPRDQAQHHEQDREVHELRDQDRKVDAEIGDSKDDHDDAPTRLQTE